MNTAKAELVERAFNKATALNSKAKTLKGALAAIYKAGFKPICGFQALARHPIVLTLKPPAIAEWPAKHELRVQMRCQAHLATLKQAQHPHIVARETASRWTTDASSALLRAADAVVISRVQAQLDWPYRRAESRWAGGKHNTKILVGEIPNAACDTVRAWSRNGKWTGNNSEAVLTISRQCLELLGPGIEIDGLITLDAELIEPGIFKATWAEQSVGFSLKVVEGWIVDGYHSTAATLAKAKKQAEVARAKSASVCS